MFRILQRYTLALGIAAFAIAARYWLDPILHDSALFVVFIPAVMVSAWLFGAGPGAACMIVCGMAAGRLWLLPEGMFAANAPEVQVTLALYGMLSTGLIWMVHRAKRDLEVLRHGEERARSVVDHVLDGIVTIDAQAIIQTFNTAAEEIFGYSAAEVIGKNVKLLMPEPYFAQHDQYIQHYLQTGEKKIIGIGREVVGRRKDGSVFPMDLAVAEFRLGEGRYFTGIIRDITERKRGEERLRAANMELSDFATIVSHDLKSPLRAVATLANWLRTDYAEKLDAEGRENLAEMVKRVARMDRMIDDILAYSRLGRAEENPEQVGLDNLVAGVVQDLAPSARIHIQIAPRLPVVRGEPVRLRQLFQNLIGNAIKHGDKPETTIRVECADRGAQWQFSVADNGPGIEEQHFERIFRIFQTLAPKDKTDSNGVGLALVKRIVDRAGGRIWLESRIGEGTTFYFTWPKAAPQVSGVSRRGEAEHLSSRGTGTPSEPPRASSCPFSRRRS